MHREHGFSLVEIMVVLVVIGLLVAIGIPTFLGAHDRAADAAARQSATISLTTARVMLTDGSYADVTPADLEAAEPSVGFVDGTVASTGSDTVSVFVPDRAGAALTFVVAVYSSSGTCFYLVDVANAMTGFGSLAVPSPSDCTAEGYGAAALDEAW